MKEKFMMTSCLLAGVGDVATSALGLSVGLREVSPLAGQLVEAGNADAAFISRMASTAVLIGLYALSRKHAGVYTQGLDNILGISNVIAWGVVALNILNITRQVAQCSH